MDFLGQFLTNHQSFQAQKKCDQQQQGEVTILPVGT